MTILINNNNTTGFTNTGRIFCTGRGNFQLYTCGASGNITSLSLYWGDTTIGSENLILMLCSLAGNVLASTAAITTPASATQFVSGAISSTAVVAGTQYYIGFIANPTNGGSDGRLGVAYASVSGDYTDTVTAFTYPTPPASWGSISADAGNPTWTAYADGAAGGGDTLMGQICL